VNGGGWEKDVLVFDVGVFGAGLLVIPRAAASE
jgi:hypothetical protein